MDAQVLPVGTSVRPPLLLPQQSPSPVVVTPHVCLFPALIDAQVLPVGTSRRPSAGVASMPGVPHSGWSGGPGEPGIPARLPSFPQQSPSPDVVTPHELLSPPALMDAQVRPLGTLVCPL